MKYKEPIKGKGIRNLFKSRGYQIYLVDEFRTSCKCANCDGGCCEKFMFRKSPKPFRKNNNLRLVHGLLKCKTCESVWNRDCNGATNIYKIAYNKINDLERSGALRSKPSYLCRNPKNLSDVLDDQNQNLHNSEMSKP